MISKPEDSIPAQEKGTAVNVEESVEFDTEKDAQTFFQKVKERLFNVNGWHQYAGALSADFTLTDENGHGIARKPQEGDYFKINIPAPGTQSGDGYDWVQVEKIFEEARAAYECTSVRVRPASSPVNDSPGVAHFYTDEATSDFIVERKGRKVTAGVYGRNEKPNVKAADSILDKVRNVLVGTGGISGFAKLQWIALVSGLLARDE